MVVSLFQYTTLVPRDIALEMGQPPYLEVSFVGAASPILPWESGRPCIGLVATLHSSVRRVPAAPATATWVRCGPAGSSLPPDMEPLCEYRTLCPGFGTRPTPSLSVCGRERLFSSMPTNPASGPAEHPPRHGHFRVVSRILLQQRRGRSERMVGHRIRVHRLPQHGPFESAPVGHSASATESSLSSSTRGPWVCERRERLDSTAVEDREEIRSDWIESELSLNSFLWVSTKKRLLSGYLSYLYLIINTEPKRFRIKRAPERIAACTPGPLGNRSLRSRRRAV